MSETIRRLHHGGRLWHVTRGSAEHMRLVEQGAVEVAEGPDHPNMCSHPAAGADSEVAP
jgi:hypothetical protein